MAHYSSSSSATLPVLAPQPSYPSDSAASAAGARSMVTRQLTHLVQGQGVAASMNQQNVPFSYENNIQLQMELKLPEDYRYDIKKLTHSDVDRGQCRLLLPKRFGEHIFRSMHIHDPRGLPIEVLDVDENGKFELRLKQWSSTKSYVLTGNWIENFVDRKKLKKGDNVVLTYHGSKLYFKHFENHN